MIMPTKGLGGIAPMIQPANYLAATSAGKECAQSAEGQFDQVNLSHSNSNVHKFQRELVARLVQETRTVNTTGDIQRIKSEVQSGTLKPDASEIAAKLLLEESASGYD